MPVLFTECCMPSAEHNRKSILCEKMRKKWRHQEVKPSQTGGVPVRGLSMVYGKGGWPSPSDHPTRWPVLSGL